MSFDLDSRVVLVTGGGGFLALEFARLIGRAGGLPVLTDVDATGAEVNRTKLADDGIEADVLAADITDEQQVRSLVTDVVRRHGRLDGLVNGAAIDPKFDEDDPGVRTFGFENYPLELWQQSLAVNLTGTFLVTREATRHFLGVDRGVIVNVASMYGMVGPDQRLYVDGTDAPARFKPVDYSVTKSALYGFTRYLAAYFAGTGVRANAVTFGGIDRNHDDDFRRRYAERAPMQRMGRPDEVGGAIVFLLSDASSYMTGANVVVDGGWTAW